MTVLTTNHAIDSDTVRSPLRAPCGARHRGRYDVTGQQSADVMTWTSPMKRLDRYERDILSAYEKGALVSARRTKAQLGAFREAARATFIKNRRVNIRLSAVDLMDIQAKAYEEGVPYQTLIASVLHKYVSGRLQEKKSRPTTGSTATARKRAAR